MRKLLHQDAGTDTDLGTPSTISVPRQPGVLSALTAGEREKVLPVLEAAARRADAGNYTFTDQQHADTWEREGQPNRFGMHQPGLEARHSNDVAAARKVMQNRGQGEVFDSALAAQQRKFLERRRAETAEVLGDSVSDILDWMQSAPEAAYLSAQVDRAAEWLKAKRLAEIKQKPFFQRMSARIGRVRNFLGNDHGNEHIDVVADVVAILNASGPRETLSGAEFMAALRGKYPEAFASAGVPASAVRQRADLN